MIPLKFYPTGGENRDLLLLDIKSPIVVKSASWNAEDVEKKDSTTIALETFFRNLLSRENMRTIKTRALAIYVSWLNNRQAQGYTEYIILIGLIAIAAYLAVQTLGNEIASDLFTRVSPSV